MIFPLKPPFIVDFPLPCLITRDSSLNWWIVTPWRDPLQEAMLHSNLDGAPPATSLFVNLLKIIHEPYLPPYMVIQPIWGCMVIPPLIHSFQPYMTTMVILLPHPNPKKQNLREKLYPLEPQAAPPTMP